MSLPMVKLVLQQDQGDCAVAALAMMLGESYLDVFTAATQAQPPDQVKAYANGFTTEHIIATALTLGTTLVLKRSWEPDECGLLAIERIRPKKGVFRQHMVLLKWELIFDTDGTVWEVEDYLHTLRYRPLSLLVEE